jgi:hypothetical protein
MAPTLPQSAGHINTVWMISQKRETHAYILGFRFSVFGFHFHPFTENRKRKTENSLSRRLRLGFARQAELFQVGAGGLPAGEALIERPAVAIKSAEYKQVELGASQSR